jgi:hypothetical protein
VDQVFFSFLVACFLFEICRFAVWFLFVIWCLLFGASLWDLSGGSASPWKFLARFRHAGIK